MNNGSNGDSDKGSIAISGPTREEPSRAEGGSGEPRTAVQRFRSQVVGPVFAPDEDGYDAEVASYDLALHHRPDVVVGATDAADVGVAIRMANTNDLAVSVLGAGHAPYPEVRGGLMITTRRLVGVTVDAAARTATVAAGARWQEVIDAAATNDLAPLCGSAPGVGVVGMTLGGGIGPIGRTFGFSADHVRALRLVDLSGGEQAVTADDHPELFWGLRGGKRTLGVVTEMTIDLLPLSTIFGGGLYFAPDHIASLLNAYQQWATSTTNPVPEALTTSVAILRLPDLAELPPTLRGQTVGHLRVGYVGDADDGRAAVAPLLAAVDADPMIGSLDILPYQQIGTIHGDPTNPSAHRSAGLLLNRFDSRACEALLRLAGPARRLPVALVEIRHLGGVYAQQPPSTNAVGGRDAGFNLWVASPALPNPCEPQVWEATRASVRSVIDGMSAWSAGGAQVNFIGSENTGAERAGAFPTDITRRLDTLEAKQRARRGP